MMKAERQKEWENQIAAYKLADGVLKSGVQRMI
jgi:hypothetical protein